MCSVSYSWHFITRELFLSRICPFDNIGLATANFLTTSCFLTHYLTSHSANSLYVNNCSNNSNSFFNDFKSVFKNNDDPGDRVVLGEILRPLTFRDCMIESRRRRGYLFPVTVYESGWSLLQGSHPECGVSECARETSYRGLGPSKKKNQNNKYRVKINNFEYLSTGGILTLWPWKCIFK